MRSSSPNSARCAISSAALRFTRSSSTPTHHLLQQGRVTGTFRTAECTGFGTFIVRPYPFGWLAERALCRAAAPVPARHRQCLDREHGRASVQILRVWAQALACPSGRHVCRLDLVYLPDRFLSALRSDLVA